MSNSPKSHEVLVVDDDPIVVKVLSTLLKDAEFTVATTHEAIFAFDLLNEDPSRFSAVILDRMMPSMSGLDLLHKIYLRPELRHIPIIMLTSHAERKDVGAAMIAGVYDFLYKPIDKDLLLLVLKRALRDKAPKGN
ncbi:MAG TPA: response regulator [Gammaproteobacteria bacterium]|nr:response regulator [Gammaproteobacteria bacterium]